MFLESGCGVPTTKVAGRFTLSGSPSDVRSFCKFTSSKSRVAGSGFWGPFFPFVFVAEPFSSASVGAPAPFNIPWKVRVP